jgi:hypothetical protein
MEADASEGGGGGGGSEGGMREVYECMNTDTKENTNTCSSSFSVLEQGIHWYLSLFDRSLCMYACVHFFVPFFHHPISYLHSKFSFSLS